jgi:hypothetical protein
LDKGKTMADMYGSYGGGAGNTQIIGGKRYTLYSPEWYAARDANKIQQATVAGQAQNAQATAANPALAGLLSSISGGLTGSGSASGGTGSFGGVSSGTSGAGTSGVPAVTSGSTLPAIQLPDTSAADSAIFASAKDRVGQTGRASLDALRGELGATGALGGGAEVAGVRDIIRSGQGELGQVSRDQAVQKANQAADFAKTSYEGGITQRGQDVSAAEAQARLAQERELEQSRLAFQQQQAAASNQLQMLQLALSGLKAAY